jgi:drug/metabolite transporter (DMT)-like permease
MYFLGLTQTFAVNATLIAHLQPLFVAIFGVYLLKESLHKHEFAAGGAVILAVVLITGRTVDNLANLRLGNIGDLVTFLAMLGWAIVAIPGKQLTREVDSAVIVGYRFLIASAVFMPILLLLNQLYIGSIYQVLLGVVVGLGYIFYYEGLKRLKASQVALTELSSPFFATILAWHFLGETTTPMQVAGALLLMLGLYILAQGRPDSEEPDRH